MKKLLLKLITVLTLAIMLYHAALPVMAMDDSQAVSITQSQLGDAAGQNELTGSKRGIASGTN